MRCVAEPKIAGVEMLPQGLLVAFEDASWMIYSIRTLHVALYLNLQQMDSPTIALQRSAHVVNSQSYLYD